MLKWIVPSNLMDLKSIESIEYIYNASEQHTMMCLTL